MTRNRSTAYGGQDEAREVVVTVDRRLIYAVGLIAAFVIAVGAGFAATSGRLMPGGSEAVSGAMPAAATPAAEGLLPQISEADARATAGALGLDPNSVNIVTPIVPQQVTEVPGAAGTPAVGAADAAATYLPPGMTPAASFEYDQSPAAQTEAAERYKTGEVLATVVDPNVTAADYAPLRLETVSKPVDGPRLAISDLNLTNSYDLGVVAMDQRVSHTFTAKNVGTADLVVSRIYTGCGCTATTVGDEVIPPDGVLTTPLVLKPGESREFTVEYDASRENRPGATAKYVQIFTNDPDNVRFDEADPNSHETRFRLVVEPQYFVSTPVP